VDRPTVNFGFSSCPNDTFAFHALVHGLAGAVRVTPHIDDIEALNLRAASGDAEVTKVSIAAYGHGLRDRYVLLRAGGAAGFGVGPIVVARSQREVGGRIAIPGERTTANLLLRLLGRFETVVMRFDQIEDAVLRGDADCGLLIHEGRFTYAKKGLTLLCDLGTVWEERMQCPLPLAAIAIRRDLAPHLAAMVDDALRASVEYAFAHPGASRDYVASLAQEMDPEVTARHIQLYVNDYTRALDERAVATMLEWGEQQGAFPRADRSVAAFVPAAAGA
jgi:1,4-dihydroxy-6-naphthoate synthase